uniref:V-set immunoregulatory receptor n=1 Tax=Anas platyrhynchos TaxID=8839 RepID=A0A8B9SMU7_ANAPL
MERVTPPLLLLLLALLALLASHGGTLALLVTAPYARCVCPEGQNVTLSCRVSGPLADRHDLLYKTWYFSSAGDQSCSEKQHIRNLTERELHHVEPGRHHGTAPNGTARAPHGWQGGHRGVEFVPNHHGAFHIVVMNLTLQDSGNYCCYAMEVRREHGKPQTLQVAHGFVELQIQRGRGELQNCTFYTANSKDITAAALATGACIVGILCLPLILVLIYKQRQAVSSRRTYSTACSPSHFPVPEPQGPDLGRALLALAKSLWRSGLCSSSSGHDASREQEPRFRHPSLFHHGWGTAAPRCIAKFPGGRKAKPQELDFGMLDGRAGWVSWGAHGADAFCLWQVPTSWSEWRGERACPHIYTPKTSPVLLLSLPRAPCWVAAEVLLVTAAPSLPVPQKCQAKSGS